MNDHASVSRHVCAFVTICFLSWAPSAGAQTTELAAGGGRFIDTPGPSVQLTTRSMAVGPDGMLYVADYNGRLLRVDVAQRTVTALPGVAGSPNFDLLAPSGLAFDAAGDLFVVQGNELARFDATTGAITQIGYLEGGGQMAFAADGTLYYASADDHQVRARLPSGEVIVVAGSGEQGFGGDGGPASLAQLDSPYNIAFAPNGDLFIADTGNDRVRRVDLTTGVISTVAGYGNWEYNGEDLPAIETSIEAPRAIAFDAAGNLFVYSPFRIRRIDAATGLARTVVGNGNPGPWGDGGPATDAFIGWGESLAIDASGNLFIADGSEGRIRMVAAVSGIIDTLAGNGEYLFCGEGVLAQAACLGPVRGIDFDLAGNLLLSDEGTERLRTVNASTNLITTVGTPPYRSIRGIERDADGNIYYASFDNRVYRVNPVTGVRTVIAGTGSYAFGGDGGPATAARLAAPSDVAIDVAGNIYISDTANHRVRRIDASTGIISSYAGAFVSALGDGGPATMARLNNPTIIEFDAAGNLVIVDGLHCRLRRVEATTGFITTIAGNGTCASLHTGDGGPATAAPLAAYAPIALDPAGNIFTAWSGQLRHIDAVTGIITTIPAPGGSFRAPEGQRLQSPVAMKFDSAGRLYVSETSDYVVLRISGLPFNENTDNTPPIIMPAIMGTSGNNGWYTSDVQVVWSVIDSESTVTSQQGCTPSVVTVDGGSTFECVATSAGGTSVQTVTILRDATAPTLSYGQPLPNPAANGWYNSAVSIPFTVSDATSGVAVTSHTSPVILSEDGAGERATVVVVDAAGNTAEFPSLAVNIDRTAPVVQPVLAGLEGSGGWYRGDVQLSWSIDEMPASIDTVSGCDDASVIEDTSGVTFNCSVTSAGGTASSSITVRRDATPPVLSFGNASPLPNAAGWNRSNVSVPFTRSDALSGLASTSSASPLIVSQEGGGVLGTVTVTDQAGNVAVFNTSPLNIDKTAPVIDLASPANGTEYGYYATVAAQYTCSDAVSGTASCAGPLANGALLNTRTRNGRYTFRVTARDVAGNTGTLTHAWSVAGGFNFEGFLAPADNMPTLNGAARNTRVPIRWRLPDGNGGFVSNTASYQSISVTHYNCTGSVDPLGETTTNPVGISFDPATSVFTYNWNTGPSPSTCRSVVFRLRDGVPHEILFRMQ